MNKKIMRAIAGGLVFAFTPEIANSHALAQRYDLPLPLSYFLVAAGVVVAATFIILSLAIPPPKRPGVKAQVIASGTVPIILVTTVKTLSVALLIVIILAGLFGNQNPFKNLAPVAVWVIWWVGLGLVSAFVCNVWTLLNPFSTLFDLAESLLTRRGFRRPPWLAYPRWLGAWPACGLFFLFAWLELVAPNRDVPRNIAIAILIYSGLTFACFAVFGRQAWLRGGEVFSVVFGLFARFAPLHFDERGSRWVIRPYAAALHTDQPLDASMIACTLAVLGTVTVDGFMETPLWAATSERLLVGAINRQHLYMVLASALLLAGPLLLAALYLLVIAMMRRLAGGPKKLAGRFVLSLIPIAIAYHLAHYFSLFAIAGQFIIPIASDPFGYGWDLFGTTLYRINIGIVDARFIWYLAMIAIVIGHMIAVWLAHVAAGRAYSNLNAARRGQYPMLVLMVTYTTLSLWILAQPIVEPVLAGPTNKNRQPEAASGHPASLFWVKTVAAPMHVRETSPND